MGIELSKICIINEYFQVGCLYITVIVGSHYWLVRIFRVFIEMLINKTQIYSENIMQV